MLFNSINFAIFLPVVFILYWFVTNRNLKLQNFLLLVSSCYFYASWDWRFLFLLLISIFLVYYPGRLMSTAKSQKQRKFWLVFSIILSLGFLGIFKYYNFFVDSFAELFSGLGFQMNPRSLNVILPIGISFYTFHGLSYIIDLYKGRIEEEKNFVNYAVFVSFFPLLIAGPIERATHLLPQIKASRKFDYHKAVDGLGQILWGLFKKIVIADNCANYANMIFDNYEKMNSLSLILGAFYFSIQIYCDFSGYSDIAIGTARLFGIELLRNFSFPYFSRDIAEFWRRWHISLTTWFRDYLYIPLGGSRGGTWKKIRNTFIIFLVSGFWHGANWTFIIWGGLNALYFLPLLLMKQNRKNLNIVAEGKLFPNFRELIQMLTTFFVVTIAWIFFRSNSVSMALEYLKRLFSFNFEGVFQRLPTERYTIELLLLVFSFIVLEWFTREKIHPFTGKGILVKVITILVLLITLGVYSNSIDFIYFQF